MNLFETKLTQLLANYGADVGREFGHRDNVLHALARSSDIFSDQPHAAHAGTFDAFAFLRRILEDPAIVGGGPSLIYRVSLDGKTPLHVAARHGNAQVLELLLEKLTDDVSLRTDGCVAISAKALRGEAIRGQVEIRRNPFRRAGAPQYKRVHDMLEAKALVDILEKDYCSALSGSKGPASLVKEFLVG